MHLLILKFRMRPFYPLWLTLQITEGRHLKGPYMAKRRGHMLSWQTRSKENLGGTKLTMIYLAQIYRSNISLSRESK